MALYKDNCCLLGFEGALRLKGIQASKKISYFNIFRERYDDMGIERLDVGGRKGIGDCFCSYPPYDPSLLFCIGEFGHDPFLILVPDQGSISFFIVLEFCLSHMPSQMDPARELLQGLHVICCG